MLKCKNCKKPVDSEWDRNVVFSRGDYDPFCNQRCHDDYFKRLNEEMGRINAMTDRQFYDYMGVPEP